jgi:hypothetical protein
VGRSPIVAPNGAPVARPAEGTQPITLTKTASGGLLIDVPPNTSPADLIMGAHLLNRAANKMIDAAEARAMFEQAQIAAVAAGLEAEGRPS